MKREQRMIDLKRMYDEASAADIHRNLSGVLHEYDVKPKAIMRMLGVSVHTAYAYRKSQYSSKPDLIHVIIIAEQLRLNVLDLLKGDE